MKVTFHTIEDDDGSAFEVIIQSKSNKGLTLAALADRVRELRDILDHWLDEIGPSLGETMDQALLDAVARRDKLSTSIIELVTALAKRAGVDPSLVSKMTNDINADSDRIERALLENTPLADALPDTGTTTTGERDANGNFVTRDENGRVVETRDANGKVVPNIA